MRRKQGISLIVLVITIIVMIILAASVVITLSNSGVIDRASQAVKLTDEKQVQDLAALTWAEAYLDENRTDTIENVVKDKLEEQGVTDAEWNINVTDTGVNVTKKENPPTDESTTTVYQLSGTWVLNDILVFDMLAMDTVLDVDIEWTAPSGNAFDTLTVERFNDETYGDSGWFQISWLSLWTYNQWSTSYDIANYRIMQFGSTPQEVSPEFYNWFIANATKQ